MPPKKSALSAKRRTSQRLEKAASKVKQATEEEEKEMASVLGSESASEEENYDLSSNHFYRLRAAFL